LPALLGRTTLSPAFAPGRPPASGEA